MKGWLFGINVDCSFLEKDSKNIENFGDGKLYTNLDNKFQNDRIMIPSGQFLEGYITNKNELLTQYSEYNWEKCFIKLAEEKHFPGDLRGSFCGFIKKGEQYVFFTDHIGSKAIFYYCDGEKLIVSTRLFWIVQALKFNNIHYTFNEIAAQYMLTYGYMIDDSSFIKGIKRILPGNKIIVRDKRIYIEQYYMPSLNQIQDMSEEEAVELIDKAFRIAVRREFEKDKEYGYQHLVDLSGGLDSRMVSWVAHDMGYSKQTNISYCKAGYIDSAVSSKIARDLNHEYYFKQLDDFQWIYEIDEILKLNNGEALYSGITGGKDLLSNMNTGRYGIEHTGMIGDVIISSFALDERQAFKKPVFGRNQSSTKLTYQFNQSILTQYENQEIFDLYARGFLGAMSTYAIRQNYFEVSSPFLDVDFMNSCFRIPLRYRVKHKIYLKWIEQYYKEATNYGWEKWAGVRPKKELVIWRNFVFVTRKIKRLLRQLAGKEIKDNMNPIDYWYANNSEAQTFFDKYFHDNINSRYISEELRKDITWLYNVGEADEKAQALTVLGIIKIYFEMDEC